MIGNAVLGLPLEAALEALRALGIEPEVTLSRAPRRTGCEGERRVVRASSDGASLVACAFQVDLPPDDAPREAAP